MKVLNDFDKRLRKLRQFLFGKDPLSHEDFIKITRLQWDGERFRYYLETIPSAKGGDHYHGNRFFEVTHDAVAAAEKRHDLCGLLQAIVDRVEYEKPGFYNLGLHK